MSIVIMKHAQSIITAQAVAGGTLAADTTYYVCCIFGRTTAWRDGDPHTDFTNEVSVLTTSVNRSIQINYTWTLNIIEFSDAGGGQVYVKFDQLHCLLNINSIDISGTTNYNGTYDVYYDSSNVSIDGPNRIRINATWAGDDATGTAVCDDNVIGTNSYISVRCYTQAAWSGTEWILNQITVNCWIGPGYSAPPAVQGYTVTVDPTSSGVYVGICMPYWRRDAMPKGITYYGRPYFEVTGYETFTQWRTSMVEWLSESTNYYAGSSSQKPTLYFLGHIKIQSPTTLMLISQVNFTLDGGLYSPNIQGGIDYVYFEDCIYREIGIRRPQITGTFFHCMIRDECSDSPYYNNLLIQDCSLHPSTSYVFYGTSSGQLDGADLFLPNYDNYFWYVYPDVEIPQTRVQNLNVWKGYVYIYAPIKDCSVANDTHYLENVNIYSEYDSGTPRDLYMYLPGAAYLDGVIEMLNVRAPLQANGIVRCLRSEAANGYAKFYFSLSIHVTDKDGIVMPGATLRMVNKDGVEVSDVADSSGGILVNILAYENVPSTTASPITIGDYVDYYPFVLTVEENGYQQYREEIDVLTDKIEKTIALQPAVEYVEGLISADIEEDTLVGALAVEELIGVVTTDLIMADVEEDTIYGDVEEDTITGTVI